MESIALLRDWTGNINTISNGYKKSQILFTALNAGLFDMLETCKSASDIAHTLNWSERGIAMLLDGLVALELIEKSEGHYKNTPMASACLVTGGIAYQGDILHHNANSWNSWEALPERVRTGTGEPQGENRTGKALRSFILGMNNIAKLSASELMEVADLSRYGSVLDLAGGPATYSIAFLQKYPALKATLFDKPEVIEIAREQVLQAGLDNRFSFLPGDCLTDDLGNGYDLIFMSNIIHSFSNEDNQRLVRRAFEALMPGGTLIIKDFILENDRSGPAFSLIFALHMLVHTPAGNTYTFEEVQSWTDAAGFNPGRALPMTPQTRLWLTDKPA